MLCSLLYCMVGVDITLQVTICMLTVTNNSHKFWCDHHPYHNTPCLPLDSHMLFSCTSSGSRDVRLVCQPHSCKACEWEVGIRFGIGIQRMILSITLQNAASVRVKWHMYWTGGYCARFHSQKPKSVALHDETYAVVWWYLVTSEQWISIALAAMRAARPFSLWLDSAQVIGWKESSHRWQFRLNQFYHSF